MIWSKKDCIECFQGEYKFKGRYLHTGEYWSVELSESIQYNERIQIDQFEHEKLAIPPEFQAETVDLSCPDISFFNKKKGLWLTQWFFVFKVCNLLVNFCNIQLIVI